MGPVFLVDPRLGDLFIVEPDKRMRRVDKSLRDLVALSPFTSADGSVFVASKASRVIAVDPLTGALQHQYALTPDPDAAAGPDTTAGNESSGSILVGRTEYTVLCYGRGDGVLRWNMTYAEYAQARRPWDALRGLFYYYSQEAEGSMVLATDSRGHARWTRLLPTPPLHLYTVGPDGSLAKIVLKPFDEAATLAIGSTTAGLLYVREVLARLHAPPAIGAVGPDSTALARIATPICDGVGACPNPGALAIDPDPQPYTLLPATPFPLALAPDPILLPPGATAPPRTPTGPPLAYTLLGAMAVTIIALLFYIWTLRAAVFTAPSPSLPTASADTKVTDAPPPRARGKGKSGAQTSDTASAARGAEGDGGAAIALSTATSTTDSNEAESSGAGEENAQSKEESETDQVMGSGEGELDDDNGEQGEGDKNEADTKKSSGRKGKHHHGKPHHGRRRRPRFEELGKLRVDTNTVLGHGSHGTVVFRGEYEGRAVAVKRVLCEYVEVVEQEVALLRRLDHHPHVVRYYSLDYDGEFAYIALHLCLASLVQVVEGPGVSTRGTHHGASIDPARLAALDRTDLARQFLSGLSFLHNHNIVHRDVKPQNVLLSERMTVMISDFGLCATLADDQSSFEATHAGTVGWVAPESILNGRKTKAVDVFSAGCVIHYLLTSHHPFGPHYERERNIRHGRPKMAALPPLAEHLVTGMLAMDPDQRWTCTQALCAPIFWPPSKQLHLLQDVSDRVEKETVGSPLLALLETDAAAVVGADWRTALDSELLNDLGRFRKYNYAGVVDLLRALRNKKHHYQELPQPLKDKLGSIPDGFLAYFTSRYPRLLIHVFRAMTDSCMSSEPPFRIYFEPAK